MTRSNKKQPTDKKPVANSELWREIPIGLQGKVRGGNVDDNGDDVLSLERKTLSLLRDVSGFYNQYGLFVRYVG